MSKQDRLKALANEELLAGLTNIVRKRNAVTSEMLAYLAELDERQLYLDIGFPSLFQYCIDVLGLCESTAGRHIAAARVCREHPQAFALVESGALHASALSLMRKHVTRGNAAELFDLCQGKSARRVEELLAARFPRPDVPDLVRRLPSRPIGTPDVESAAAQRQPINPSTSDATNPSSNDPTAPASVPPAVLPSSPNAPALRAGVALDAARPRIEPLSADRFGVHFTADGEFRELLQRVRDLVGHRLPNVDLLTLLKRGLQAYERDLEKERFAIGRKPRATRRNGSSPAPESQQSKRSRPSVARSIEPDSPQIESSNGRQLLLATRTRRRSAATAREVFTRDGRQCSFVSSDGRRCSSRRCLELDHIHPWALGGVDEPRNLRVLCRAHNQRYARQCFGRIHIEAAVARKRRLLSSKKVSA